MGCTASENDKPDINKNLDNRNIIIKVPTLPNENKNGFDIVNIRQKALRLHNEFRKKHNSPELKNNKELNENAQKYAEKLIKNKNKKDFHNNIFNNILLGENIIISNKKTPEDICNEWYKESDCYDFSLNKYQKDSGHFTQMIWKDTKEFGFGFCFDDESNFCAVALYYPPGNILGEFSKNIQKSN